MLNLLTVSRLKSDDTFLMKPSCWRLLRRLVILSSLCAWNTCFPIHKHTHLSLEKCTRTRTDMHSFETNCRTQWLLLHTCTSTSVSFSHNAHQSHSRFLRQSTAWLLYKQTAHFYTTFEPKQSIIITFIHKIIQLLTMTHSFKFQNARWKPSYTNDATNSRCSKVFKKMTINTYNFQ